MVLVFVFKLFVLFILNACVYSVLFYVLHCKNVTRKYGKIRHYNYVSILTC